MMKTKYEELNKLAIIEAKKHFDNRGECENITNEFTLGYAKYLECGYEKIQLLTVDINLKIIKDTNKCIANNHLVLGNDNMWYFAIRVEYSEDRTNNQSHYLFEYFKVGIYKNDKKTSMKFNENIFDIKDNNYGEAYKYIFEDSLNTLGKPGKKNKGRIGFVG